LANEKLNWKGKRKKIANKCTHIQNTTINKGGKTKKIRLYKLLQQQMKFKNKVETNKNMKKRES
jgi:5-hydroxyisourate hydrolase-like protein (transthyretin family)